jgi:hypothetical protein
MENKFEKQQTVVLIIREHIIEIIKVLEKQRYNYSTVTIKKSLNIKDNFVHDTTNKIISNLLQNLLNYMHHMINNRMDDSLNSIFDEIRMNFFIHNSCLIQKYVDIFKIIYNNVNYDDLEYTTLDDYLESFICQIRIILKIHYNNILQGLTECDIKCKMVYDPDLNPITISL